MQAFQVEFMILSIKTWHFSKDMLSHKDEQSALVWICAIDLATGSLDYQAMTEWGLRKEVQSGCAVPLKGALTPGPSSPVSFLFSFSAS